jgi:protein-S-isoprenylcysteine O-methyltransferase Ste14
MPVIAIFTQHLLYHFAVLIAWSAAIAFAASLAYLVYFYAVTLANPAGDPDRNVAHIAINTAAFAIFAFHHSVMARTSAKQWLARIVPRRFERATYVWVASALAVGFCVAWQPVAGLLYTATGLVRLALILIQLAGVVLVVWAARALSVKELAGIHQAQGQPSTAVLTYAGPFQFVRHPIYLGWVLMVGATPTLTANRATFAVISTLYLILAIPWEEKSLAAGHGGQYSDYRRQVGWRLIPGLW